MYNLCVDAGGRKPERGIARKSGRHLDVEAIGSARVYRALIIAAALLAIGYGLTLKGNFTYQDEHDYYSIAVNVLHRHFFSSDGIRATAHRPPGYPIFLLVVLAFHESIVLAKIANLFCWLAAAFLASQIANELYGSTARSLSLLFVLFYPVALYTAGTVYPQILTSSVFLLSVYLHFRSFHTCSTNEAIVQGFIFAILILSVPLYMANLAVFLTFVFFEPKGFKRALATLSVVVLAVTLWTFRNYNVYGRFVAIATNSGENLIFGNSALTGPNTGTNLNLYAVAPAAASVSTEIQRDAIFRKYAVDWITHNPSASALLFAKKLVNWFNYRNQLAVSSESSQFRNLLLMVTYYPLLAMALLQIATRRLHLTRPEGYLCASYAIAAIAYAVFFTRIRFRVPFDYLIIILASGYAKSLMTIVSGARRENIELHSRSGTEPGWSQRNAAFTSDVP